jgi:hypothetical protein
MSAVGRVTGTPVRPVTLVSLQEWALDPLDAIVYRRRTGVPPFGVYQKYVYVPPLGDPDW